LAIPFSRAWCESSEKAVRCIPMSEFQDTHWLDTVQRLFKKARRDLYYPPVSRLEPAEIETIQIAMSARKHKMLIGRSVLDAFSDEAVLGIFHHELNHWSRHPYDLRTIILEHSWLSEAVPKDRVRNLFDDVVVNLDLIVNRGLEQVAQAYREMPPSSGLDRLLRTFYRRVTGADFGSTELDPGLEERMRSLLAMDFLDLTRVRIKNNIKGFAEIVADLLDEPLGLPFALFSLRDFRSEEIFRAMESIAGGVTPQEYQNIAAEILKEFEDPGLKLPVRRSSGKSISPGKKDLLQELQAPDVSWYRSRARRYSVSIESLVRQGSLYPDQIMSFDLEDCIDHFSPVESYGKILPCLAKKHQMAEFEHYGECSVPDAVIMMDSSGSMANPEEVVSCAVLGAFAIARNYFELGAKVGVINFSNSNLQIAPTRDRQAVYELLKTYQGHGTTLHTDDLYQYAVGLQGDTKDFILITDAGIENIDKVIGYFSGIERRLTVIWIKGEADFNEKFRENYEAFIERLPASVTFVEIGREQDIPRIAVGRMFGRIHGND